MTTLAPGRPELIPADSVARPRRSLSALWRWAKWLLPALLLAALVPAVLRFARAPAEAPMKYETKPIDRGPIGARVTASGTVSALVTVLVGSQVSGRVDSIRVDFNSPVKKGDTVATIEPSLFRAAVEQARANGSAARAHAEKARAEQLRARRQHARALLLREAGLVSLADLETAEANEDVGRAEVKAADAAVKQAEAALHQAELNLKYATIISPIDGVVISRNVDVGQTVAATLAAPTLFTIAQDLGHMQVDTSIAEADIGKIRQGMAATFTVDAHPGRTFSGSVRQVRNAAQTLQNVVTYDAVIDVDNADRALKPGMTANVTFIHDERSDVLRLPNAALRFRPDASMTALMSGTASVPDLELAHDQRFIWLLDAGRAVRSTVRVGISDGTHTEMVEGDLEVGDQLITEAIAKAKSAR